MGKKEYVPRQVIDSQLLAALDDKAKVAIVCSEDDLMLLIQSLRTQANCEEGARHHRCNEYRRDLEQLRDSAFRYP